MSRKLMVLALAAVLVVAVALPVVAQERTVTPKLQKISKRALKKSKTALRTARKASRQARAAEALAGTANASAAEAKAAAAQARAAVESARVQSAFAPAGVEASTDEFVSLDGGPTVTVVVPPSGLIEVWAQAKIFGEGAVSLFEDGAPVSGQADFCSPQAGTGVLFAVSAEAGEPITASTPAAAGIGICGSLGAPGPVLFQTTPGTHTYELRYASCGCEDAAESAGFTERRLFVAPRP